MFITSLPPLRVLLTVLAVLLAVATNSSTCAAGGRRKSSASRYLTAYACEGNELRIECAAGTLIDLIRANYGRFSISTCNDEGNLEWSVDCMSARSFRVMQEVCGHQRSCRILASSLVFGDACNTTSKYLETHYRCIPEVNYSFELEREGVPTFRRFGDLPDKEEADSCSISSPNGKYPSLGEGGVGGGDSGPSSVSVTDLSGKSGSDLPLLPTVTANGDQLTSSNSETLNPSGDTSRPAGHWLHSPTAQQTNAATSDINNNGGGQSSNSNEKSATGQAAEVSNGMTNDPLVPFGAGDGVAKPSSPAEGYFPANQHPHPHSHSHPVHHTVSGGTNEPDGFLYMNPATGFDATGEGEMAPLPPTHHQPGHGQGRTASGLPADVWYDGPDDDGGMTVSMPDPMTLPIKSLQSITYVGHAIAMVCLALATGIFFYIIITSSSCAGAGGDAERKLGASPSAGIAGLGGPRPGSAAANSSPARYATSGAGSGSAIIGFNSSSSSPASYGNNFLDTDRIVIHANLTLTLLVAEVVFLLGISQVGYRFLCGLIAAVLHYLFLSTFIWIFFDAFLLYVLLVEVYQLRGGGGSMAHSPTAITSAKSRARRIRYYTIGYGLPALIVLLSGSLDPVSYGTRRACWLQTDNYFIFSFVGPVIAILIGTFVFLAIGAYLQCRSLKSGLNVAGLGYGLAATHAHSYPKEQAKLNNISGEQSIKSQPNFLVWLRDSIILVVLVALTWCLALLFIAYESRSLAYLFSVANACQGLFICTLVVHCVLCASSSSSSDGSGRSSLASRLRGLSWVPSCFRACEDVDLHSASGTTTGPIRPASYFGNSSSSTQINLSVHSGAGSVTSTVLVGPNGVPIQGPNGHNNITLNLQPIIPTGNNLSSSHPTPTLRRAAMGGLDTPSGSAQSAGQKFYLDAENASDYGCKRLASGQAAADTALIASMAASMAAASGRASSIGSSLYGSHHQYGMSGGGMGPLLSQQQQPHSHRLPNGATVVCNKQPCLAYALQTRHLASHAGHLPGNVVEHVYESIDEDPYVAKLLMENGTYRSLAAMAAAAAHQQHPLHGHHTPASMAAAMAAAAHLRSLSNSSNLLLMNNQQQTGEQQSTPSHHQQQLLISTQPNGSDFMNNMNLTATHAQNQLSQPPSSLQQQQQMAMHQEQLQLHQLMSSMSGQQESGAPTVVSIGDNGRTISHMLASGQGIDL